MMTTVVTIRMVKGGCRVTTTASTKSTNTTNHGSWRGPSTRLESTSGTSRLTSGT